MSRSSVFLDSFWRLSQKNSIPDRWLIRDQDLDQLGRVLNEKNAEPRLRMLKRMERFMECYPPYWYYVARTQQQLGLTDDALETYQRLTDIGSGHFRQDDMLASSMANMALLQELQGHPDAARTAARVMDYSIRNWESNLICAWVLGRHTEYDNAEELILCNLDEGVEPEQSRVALVSLYYHSENKTKLATLLNDPQVVQDVPIPGLLLSARLLGSDAMPAVAQDYLVATLSASIRRTGRGDTVTLAASPGWKLHDARPQVASGSQPFQAVGYRSGQLGLHADFVPQPGSDGLAEDARMIRLILNYPGTAAIHITMKKEAVSERATVVQRGPFSPGIANLNLRPTVRSAADVRFEISEIELEGVRLSFRDDIISNDARTDDLEKEVSSDEPVSRF